MIAANKNLLKANLNQGVLGIQSNLIDLYSSNLNSIATQAALIAGFAFTALISTSLAIQSASTSENALSYFYYVFFTICFISAIVVLSQATLVVNLGPSMALKGNNNDAVKIAATHMLSNLLFIYKTAFLSISSLFLGACVFCWSSYPVGIATIATFCYIIGYYTLIKHGYSVFTTFAADALSDSFDENSAPSTSQPSSKSIGFGFLGGSSNYKPVNTANENNEALVKAAETIEATKLKARGIIWRRQPVEEGGIYVKCYAVVDKGLVDFFRSPKEFKDGGNPINKKPLKLWELDLETDPRKYAKRVTNVRNAFTSALIGNEDFGVTDLMSSEYDLKYASKHFKFALVPKVASELAAVFTVEFIAHDEASFKQWTQTFGTIIDAYDSLAANPSVEQTMRAGVNDVETVVLAANNSN